MFRPTICCGLVLSMSSLAGCQQPVSTSGHALENIVAAYQQAIADGQFATRLSAFVHPELNPLPGNNLMLANRAADTTDRAQWKATSSVRELSANERAELGQYFDFAVTPTHVIEFTTEATTGPTTWTKVSPLYLARSGGGWNVVIGELKSPAQLAANRQDEQLTYQENDGLWRQHWELQFDLRSPYAYELALKQVGVETPVETILAKDDIQFCDDQKMIRFHTLPQAADAAWEISATGRISLPYACQAGMKSQAAWVDLPARSIRAYQPNREPRFENDQLTLARLQGEDEQGPVEFELVVTRSAL